MPAYTGSCACSAVQYVLLVAFPPDVHAGQLTPPNEGNTPFMEIYKCNCTRCHKMGFFHLRPRRPAEEFFLVTPIDPFAALGDYTLLSHWFFCKTCGVRVFTFGGEGEVVERDFAQLGDNVKELGTRKVWKPKPEGLEYLSVNATTLDAGQEGLDLREWSENKWIGFLDGLKDEGMDRYDRPHVGGTY